MLRAAASMVLFSICLSVCAALPSGALAQDDAQAAVDSSAEPSSDQSAGATGGASQRWPYVRLKDKGAPGDDHTIWRGPGGYLNPWRIGVTWLLFAFWVKTTDWVDGDCRAMRLNYAIWNGVIFATFFVALILVWLIPMFFLGFTIAVLTYVGSLGAYIYTRNEAAENHEKILTVDHLGHLATRWLGRIGIKFKKGPAYEKGAQVDLSAQGGGSGAANSANLIKARQSPGYVSAKNLLADAIEHRAEMIMLDFSREAVGVRYRIDGVWLSRSAIQREEGDMLLAVAKTLAALNPGERRERQSGTLGCGYQSINYDVGLTTQGVESGERAVFRFQTDSVVAEDLEQLGVRDKLREQIQALLGTPQGLIVFCSKPGEGLSTLMNVCLLDCDRLVRHFDLVEDPASGEPEIENVQVAPYDPQLGPSGPLTEIFGHYPDVVVVRDLIDAKTVTRLCEFVASGKQAWGGIRSRDAVEALLRVLALDVPANTFARALRGVIHIRLLRKLCESCRIAYEPTPEVLKQLGLPAGRVKALYREPKQGEPDDECKQCHGVGFRGRLPLIELIPANDQLRDLLKQTRQQEVLRKASRSAGMRSAQEEGILLVAKGLTSVNELTRVLKEK